MQDLLKKLLFGNAGGSNGGAPSLNLSFVDGGTFSPRITFSRGTNATLTDSNGLIAWAPHNLLTNSEDFEAAAWAKSNATVTANVTVAPDGTTTADKLAEDATTNVHTVGLSAGTVGIQETFSFYAKAAERTWCVAQIGNNGVAYYDLQNGVTGTVTGGTAAIVSVGNGWFRCSISATRSSNLNNLIFTSTANNTFNYAGTAGFGIFIWGAQLNVANAPVNLLTWSEDFTNAAWTKDRVNVASNTVVAPDGTTTADKVTDTAAGANTYRIYNSVTLVAQPYTMTVYAKAAEYSWCYLRIGNALRAWYNLANGTVGTVDAGLTASVSDAGNGWYRLTCTIATATAGAGFGLVGLATGNGVESYTPTTGGMGIFIWGAQLNVGSVALPYVATTSSINVPPTYNSTTPKNLLGFTQEPENAAWTKSNSYVQQNLLTWSQDFDNAAWTTFTATVAANNVTAPDGTTTADRITATSADSAIVQSITCSTSTTYTFSVYLRADTNTIINLVLFDALYAVVAQQSITVTSQWQRFTLTGTTAASTTLRGSIGGNSTFSTGEILYAWGAQLVQGADAGQYTQTTSAAAVTRYTNWDGTLTGRKLVENTATAAHSVSQNITAITGTPYVIYCYAKAAERQYLNLSEAATSAWRASFDLLNGTVAGSAGTPSATIVSVGGGWYRCSILVTAAGASFQVAAGISNTATPAVGGPSYTGDGTSGIYVTDFQLSNSASVDPYVYNPQAAAASAAFYGPRIDYDPVTLASRGLLIEEQRTNLLTYSQDFTNVIWTKTNITVTPNSAVAPDGTTTASTYAVATSAATISWQDAVATSTTLVYTIYVKQNTGPTDANSFAFFNNTTATVLSSLTVNYSTGAVTHSVGSGATTTNVGNGWWRLSVPISSGVTVGNSVRVYPCFVGNAETAGEAAFIWGAQLEAGAFATSYIPTVASQVTRNADSASMLGDNFYTWYNPNQGTFTSTANTARTAGYGGIICAGAASANRIDLGLIGPSGYQSITVGGVDVVTYDNANAINVNKYAAGAFANSAIAYALNNSNAAVNGVAGTTDTVCTVPPATELRIGFDFSTRGLNGTVRSIRYYTVRLPDATLQQITS